MTPQLRTEDFREMSVPELLAELDAHGALGDDAFHQIVVEVQDANGQLVANLVQLHIGVDGGDDRHRWIKLTARMAFARGANRRGW